VPHFIQPINSLASGLWNAGLSLQMIPNLDTHRHKPILAADLNLFFQHQSNTLAKLFYIESSGWVL